jgi:hypothetical protein
MAIWQYNLFVLPQEEIYSYFGQTDMIRNDDLNEINWWKYRQLNIEWFDFFNDLLIRKKSWSDDIILWGDESSNCVLILIENNEIIEIFMRIDIRDDFDFFLRLICNFAQRHECALLNSALKIFPVDFVTIKEDIAKFKKNNFFENLPDR